MPVLDGWGFADALTARGLAVPVLVMTAAQDARRWAAEIAADGYLAKPFGLLDLLRAVVRDAAAGRPPRCSGIGISAWSEQATRAAPPVIRRASRAARVPETDRHTMRCRDGGQSPGRADPYRA